MGLERVTMTRFSTLRKKSERHAHRYPIACRLCEGKHPIRLCPVYRAKTPEERLREVLLGRFCGNCLSMTHRVQRCTSRDRCRRCHDKHHTTLHIDEEPVDRRPWSQQVASEEERDNVLSIYASDSGTDSRTRRPEIEEGEIIEPVAEANFPISTGGSETRTFRLPLAHKRRQHQRAPQRRGAETRSFRRRSIRKKATGQEGQRQRARQRCGAETRYLIKEDGDWTTSSEETLELLVQTHFLGCLHSRVTNTRIIGNHDDIPVNIITEENIKRAISSFQPFKSPGPDGIIPADLQHTAGMIAPILVPVFEAVLRMNYIPHKWEE
ncbi:PREDICTED: uncharacterized protein LOC108378636, partial [Rhagoletis zephyria]|uniref:uncharacterized protein LOC108378636 n=1 Tax=Rhagoletis zephyria TaxID=28612 RepID=UPI0008113CAC